MSSFTFKRGGTFTATVTYTPETGGLADLLGSTITSDIRDSAGVYHSLSTSLNGAGLVITISDPYGDTADWATGEAKWDIRVSEGGVVFYSQTISFTVIPAVTLS
jgi:hypothetical protein